MPDGTDLDELGHRLVDAVCAASTTADEIGPARPLTVSLFQMGEEPAIVAQVMVRFERARRLDVMDGRRIVPYGMALCALRGDEPEGWAGLEMLARAKRAVDIVLGKPDDLLLQAVVMPISARQLRETLPQKVAIFEPAQP